MKRTWWLAGFLVVTALVLSGLSGLPGTVQPVAAESSPAGNSVTLVPEEQALWQALNTARVASGLTPLTLDANITALTRDRSADMAARSYFGHTNPDGKTMVDLLPAYGLTYHAVGETIEFNLGIPDCGAEAARGFIASPPHHLILFDPRFTTAGVGHAVDANGKHYFTIIVLA